MLEALAPIPLADIEAARTRLRGIALRTPLVRLGLPDASVLVLQGMIFIAVLASDTLYGRFKIFQTKAA